MSRLPSGFVEDYQTMRLHFDWVLQSGPALDVPLARGAAEEISAFLDRWEGRVALREVEHELRRMRAWLGRLLEDLERVALCHLREVVEARKDWELGELFFEMSVSFIGVVRETPEEMQPELKSIYREHMGYDFDPTAEYRDSETLAEHGETLYRTALRSFQIDWPERFTASVRERLDALDLPGAQAWMDELNAAIEALGAPRRLDPAAA